MRDQNILKTSEKLNKEQTTTNNKKPLALIPSPPKFHELLEKTKENLKSKSQIKP